jgi:hypothetical protein
MALVHVLAKVSIELLAIYFHSKFSTSKLEKWRFVNQILLLSSQIVFRIVKKANVFLDDFEVLVREMYVRG